MRRDQRDRRPPAAAPIAALAVGVAVGAATGLLPRWPGLLHLVALPPLDQVADLRVLLVEATTVPRLVAGLLALTTVRVVVLSWVLGGPDRASLGLAARYYLAVLPLSAVAASLLFAAGASLFYLLFWAGLAVTLLVVAGTAALPWTGLRGALGGWLRLGTVGAYLCCLTVLGFAADLGGGWVAVALVPASAALTWVAARALVTDPGHRVLRRSVAALPAAGLAALLVVALSGPAGPPAADDPSPDRGGTLLLMSGVDSRSGSGAMLEIDPRSLGWTCDRTRYVSYAGPGDGQPQGDARCDPTSGAPYVEEDTLRATEELVAGLEAQLAEAEAPALLATHSQGVWVAWRAAATGRAPNLRTLVLVGAFPDNPSPYQVGGTGPGRLGAEVLRAVTSLGRPGGTSVFEPDSPLGVEWLGHPTAIRETLASPLPREVRALSATSVFDLPLMPRGWRIEGAVDACPIPVPHPNLPYGTELHDVIGRFVDGDDLPPCPVWRRAVGPLLRHLAVPAWRLPARPHPL